MTTEKIRCIQWVQDNGEPAEVFRLDDIGEGDRFFNMINQVGELDDEISIIEMTQEEWDEAVKLGEESA